LDAVTQVFGFRAIVKDVAEVGVAFAAENFVALEPEGPVFEIIDIFRGGGLGEARPAAAGVVFIFRAEEGKFAGCAGVGAGLLGKDILPEEGPLGSFLSHDTVLFSA